MRLLRYLPMLIVATLILKAGTAPLSLTDTVNLRAIARASLGETHQFGGFTIAQNHNGQWAATVNVDNKFHIILTGKVGTGEVKISPQLNSVADRVRIDDEGNVYTRLFASRAGVTDFRLGGLTLA